VLARISPHGWSFQLFVISEYETYIVKILDIKYVYIFVRRDRLTPGITYQ
jgi:hypothetical protein